MTSKTTNVRSRPSLHGESQVFVVWLLHHHFATFHFVVGLLAFSPWLELIHPTAMQLRVIGVWMHIHSAASTYEERFGRDDDSFCSAVDRTRTLETNWQPKLTQKTLKRTNRLLFPHILPFHSKKQKSCLMNNFPGPCPIKIQSMMWQSKSFKLNPTAGLIFPIELTNRQGLANRKEKAIDGVNLDGSFNRKLVNHGMLLKIQDWNKIDSKEL